MDTSRIVLRPFKLSDADDFQKWMSHHEVKRYLRSFTFSSRDDALKFIEKEATPHPWYRSICLEDTSIGFIFFEPGPGLDRCRARVGYAIAFEHWGRGIATTALKIAISQVFKDIPDLVRLQAIVEVENKASQRVLEKVGFLKEGLLRKYGYCEGQIRDVLIYSFLSTDMVL